MFVVPYIHSCVLFSNSWFVHFSLLGFSIPNISIMLCWICTNPIIHSNYYQSDYSLELLANQHWKLQIQMKFRFRLNITITVNIIMSITTPITIIGIIIMVIVTLNFFRFLASVSNLAIDTIHIILLIMNSSCTIMVIMVIIITVTIKIMMIHSNYPAWQTQPWWWVLQHRRTWTTQIHQDQPVDGDAEYDEGAGDDDHEDLVE